MAKKQKKSLKSLVASKLYENREAIAALATAAATAVAPKIKKKIKDFIEKKQAQPQAHAINPAEEKPAPKTRASAQPKAKKQEAAKNLPAKTEDTPKPHHYRQTFGQKLANALTSLVSKGIRNVILLGILSALLFSVGAYFIFTSATMGKAFPVWYTVFLGFMLFGSWALFGLVYGLFMALLLTVKTFSADIGSLVKDGVNRIEDRADSISNAINHHQAVEMIKQLFADLTGNIRQYAARTVAGFMTMGILSGILFLAKSIMMRSVKKVKNKADFFTLISAKASLGLAVVLNLKLFAKIALCFGVLLGIIAVMMQILIIYWVK